MVNELVVIYFFEECNFCSFIPFCCMKGHVFIHMVVFVKLEFVLRYLVSLRWHLLHVEDKWTGYTGRGRTNGLVILGCLVAS